MQKQSKQLKLGFLAVGLLAACAMTTSSTSNLNLRSILKANNANGTEEKYTTDYDSMQEVLDSAAKINEQIGEEGIVLLKNEDNTLPLARNSKISVFGKNSVNPVMSGTGSSGGTGSNTVKIIESLKNAGFENNEKLTSFYNDNDASGPVRPSMGFSSYNYNSYFPTAETPQSKYTNQVKESYKDYNDAAIVVISRTGGEGTDLPRTSLVKEEYKGKVPAAGDVRAFPTRAEIENDNFVAYGGEGRENTPYAHYLELDENEIDLIDNVTAGFDKVIVILNTSNVMELSREKLVNNNKVQSILWAPGGGQNGFSAIGKIINGEVSPSGKTSDMFASDFTKDPVCNNFGNNNVGYFGNDDAGNQYTLEDGTVYKNNFGNGVYETSYEEGIYLGYKYYETRGFTDGDAWYKEAVNYPFGYGLSYTNFKWEVSKPNITTFTKDSTIEVKVKVTNTGNYAGKDVVELYFSAPYTNGGIEKSHVQLGAFEKTKLLKPGQSDVVTLTLKASDMASFDEYDTDKDSNVGYELDAGEYNLYVGKDAHSAWKDATKDTTITLTLGAQETIKNDLTTGEEINVIFDDSSKEMKGRTLSRSDWNTTWPTKPSWIEATDELVKSTEWLKNFDMPLVEGATKENAVVATWYDEANPRYDGGKAPWYSETAPAFRSEEEKYTAANPAPIQLKDMADVPYGDAKWDEFVSQLTVNQTYEAMQSTRFQFNAQEAIGSPVAGHSDGPLGISGAWVGGGESLVKPFASYKFSFATETMVACTWNKELAFKEGENVGDYGLWANVIGWYAPGANIHRSPFSGRNFEYYSEDGMLSGLMLENVIKGARSKGMVTFIKHFALNDQETNRDTNSVATWANEQTMREIYLKPFEMAIKNADANGLMSAFNRIGFDWCGASYELLEELTRQEWGFKGTVITDAHGDGYGSMNAGQMVRAGNDLSLDSREKSISRIVNSEESNTSTQLNALHESMKRIYYTVLHSAAMQNGLSTEAKTYTQPTSSEFTVKPGDTVNINVADGVVGDEYTLLLGNLPEGLKLNRNGTITGKVAYGAKTGEYSFSVSKLLEGAGEGEECYHTAKGGWAISNVGNFKINVSNDDIVFTGNEEAYVLPNKAFSVDVGAFSKTNKALTYKIKDSTADNISISSEGKLYGSISKEGIETVRVEIGNGEETVQVTVTIYSGKSYFEGPSGADGKDGTNGTYGTDGKDGQDGKDGKDGKDGTNGTNGTDGKDGKDGTADAITPIVLSSVSLAGVIGLGILTFLKKENRIKK